MVAKTKAINVTMCHECGSYDPECYKCKIPFKDNQIIICDDERDNIKSTEKHYCTKCCFVERTKNNKLVLKVK